MKPGESKADRKVIAEEAAAEVVYQTAQQQAALDKAAALRAIADRNAALRAVSDAHDAAERAESAEAARNTFRARMMRWLGLE